MNEEAAAAAAAFNRRSHKSHRWEIFVQVERQRVELFTPRIALKRSELVPPVFASVFPDGTILFMHRVIEKICNDSSNEWLGREWNVDHVVELQSSNRRGKNVIRI